MKKSVLGLILLAVLIIIVSPGIVGKFAEDSVGENLNWAARESGELVVTSSGFDRGWFSSEGQHRITLGEGGIRSALAAAGTDADEDIPVLVINTHLDHGLIPVSSMSREEGSLAPGLGSAVSTLTVELGPDETFELPGTIYSSVGLTGDLDSRYIVEAGSQMVDGGEVSWAETRINVVSSASSGDVEFDGDMGPMTFSNDQQTVSIAKLAFEGEQSSTRYGFSVGDIDLTMGELSINTMGIEAGGMQGMSIKGKSSVDDGEIEGEARMELSGQTIPAFGDLSVIADISFSGLDATAVGLAKQRIDETATSQDPMAAMSVAQDELKAVFAGGFDLDIDQFDIALPMGTVETKMAFELPETDGSVFEWSSILLDLEGSIFITVPEELVQMATSMDPQAGAVIGMGYLKKDGSVYVMDAQMKKGLLTINGAPVPIPMGMFN